MNEARDTPVVMGTVIGGSMSRGVEVRLNASFQVENVGVGDPVTIQGQTQRFYGIVSNITLETSDPYLRATPPESQDSFVTSVITGTGAYAVVNVLPELTVGTDPLALIAGPQSTRSIPAHFAPVYRASYEDIRAIFGAEDDRHLWIGSPIGLEDARVCIDLKELVKRSNGVFGKSGTGKSFLTRILLAGIMQKGTAVNLIFDMHNEYGWEVNSESGSPVKGLKQLFQSDVAVFSLDMESSRRRGHTPDAEVQIGYGEIEPQDIETLAETLNLTAFGIDATYKLARKFGQGDWLTSFLDIESQADLGALADEIAENHSTLGALHRRLERLARMPFLVPKPPDDAVRRIMEYLDRGIHVVLEFGRYGDDIGAYILVANLLTRRIHDRYVQRMEQAAGNTKGEPPQLVITIEEAHRFLTPAVASQTIFGTIAREMRKYKVSLLIVDQRPSGIDDEVLSQLGTRFTYLLDNDRDVDAVLAGAPKARELRTVLSSLDSQQQTLIFGHVVPMAVVVRTREYGTEKSYKEFGFRDAAELRRQAKEDARDLFGPG